MTKNETTLIHWDGTFVHIYENAFKVTSFGIKTSRYG